MDGVLSQEEISALLNNSDDANQNDLLTDAEKDAIGEIGNISMGTAATTLFSLVNRKVDISTPVGLTDREIVVQGNPRVYKALRNQMAEIYEELKRLEKCSEENEELLSTLRLVAETLYGLKGDNE